MVLRGLFEAGNYSGIYRVLSVLPVLKPPVIDRQSMKN